MKGHNAHFVSMAFAVLNLFLQCPGRSTAVLFHSPFHSFMLLKWTLGRLERSLDHFIKVHSNSFPLCSQKRVATNEIWKMKFGAQILFSKRTYIEKTQINFQMKSMGNSNEKSGVSFEVLCSVWPRGVRPEVWIHSRWNKKMLFCVGARFSQVRKYLRHPFAFFLSHPVTLDVLVWPCGLCSCLYFHCSH